MNHKTQVETGTPDYKPEVESAARYAEFLTLIGRCECEVCAPLAPDSDVSCPNCGHWMKWSDRLGLFRCAWCKTKLSVEDRSVVA